MIAQVKATVTMSRDLYFDVEEDATDGGILSIAESELIYPHVAVKLMQQQLASMGIRTNLKLDLDDWEVKEAKMELVK